MIYVTHERDRGGLWGPSRFVLSDWSREELEAFVVELGIDRRRLLGDPGRVPYFELARRYGVEAIKRGAIEVDSDGLRAACARYHGKGGARPFTGPFQGSREGHGGEIGRAHV